jgi:hypothetical protein
LRLDLAKAERVVKAVRAWDAAEGVMVNAYSYQQVTEARVASIAAHTELDLAMDAWALRDEMGPCSHLPTCRCETCAQNHPEREDG